MRRAEEGVEGREDRRMRKASGDEEEGRKEWRKEWRKEGRIDGTKEGRLQGDSGNDRCCWKRWAAGERM